MKKMELEVKILDIKKEEFINKIKALGATMKDTVSCTADDVYTKYGLSMFDNREIKFENYN